MTDLERRALLGDSEAQRQCTQLRIALRCPWCKCDEQDMIGLTVWHEQYFYSCEACGCNGPIVYDNDNCDYPEVEALEKWNTRPAPPIGRCENCRYCKKSKSSGHWTCVKAAPKRVVTVNKSHYCRDFKAREEQTDDL